MIGLVTPAQRNQIKLKMEEMLKVFKMKKKRKSKSSNALYLEAIYRRAMELMEQDDVDGGLNCLLKLAGAGFKQPYGEIAIILYHEKREIEKAEEWFKKADETESLFPLAAYQYGMLNYLEKRDWKTALKYLLRSAEHGCELAYGDIGIILYLENSKIDEAEEWFKKAEETFFLYAPAAYYYGLMLSLEKGEWSQSLKYFRKAARYHYELAYGELASVLYLEEGEIDEAEEWFEKAEKAGCLSAPNAYQYGMLLIEERGDEKKGNFYLDKAAQDGYPP